MIDSKIIEADLRKLYKKFPEVKRFLVSLGCPLIEIEDIFQEGLLIFARKCEDEHFVLSVEPVYYVRNICKLLWYNQSRKHAKIATVELNEDLLAIDQSDWFQEELKLIGVEKAIAQLGKQCQELLHLFYGVGMNMVEIAKKIGLRNDKVVKTQKYRCIQKAKEALSQCGEF